MVPIPTVVTDTFRQLAMDSHRPALLAVSWESTRHQIDATQTLSSDLLTIVWSPSVTSWHNTLHVTITLQVLGSVLQICLGLLLGMTWTIQSSQTKFRKQAEERRRLNQEWLAIREKRTAIYATRRRLTKCAHCGYLQAEFDSYHE